MGAKLDCLYNDICLPCNENVNKYCLECEKNLDGELSCIECAGNRILPYCHCPDKMVSKYDNPIVCIPCSEERYYDRSEDICRSEGLMI